MTRIKKNKKGMFFTMMTIAILSLFLVTYSINSYVRDRDGLKNRIETMNSFVSSIEQDLPRKLYLSGFRTIFLVEKEMVESGNYISSFDTLFKEAFFNGTINGVDHASNGGIMYGVTYDGIFDSLNDQAESMNMNLNFSNPVITIGQEDPWNIKITLRGDLFIQDKGNLASWTRSVVMNSYIPITNFEDPLYIIETNGLITNKINQTVYSVPFSIQNLDNHLNNKYYINSTNGPSFIDRLEGKDTESVEGTGIESFVYLPDLSAQGIQVKDKSVVDYIYFSVNNPSASTVSGLPSWFKLDDSHKIFYGV